MLRLEGVSAGYGHIRALKDVSLRVAEGEIVTLIGANGAGKTTTLMAVSGVVPLMAGRITFQGRPIHGLRPEIITGLGISHVPEGRRIFQRLTVMENLDMGAYLRRDRKIVKQDLEHVFDLFPILKSRRRQAGGTLSGGEQQMLAISRALMARPRLMLLDEPSLGLAPIIIRRIFAIIQKINQEDGTTVFLVEQNANQALKISHRGYVMETGRILLSGDAERLLADPEVRKAYLGI